MLTACLALNSVTRAHGGGGAAPDPEPISQWWTPNAFLDFDPQNDRVRLDGVNYTLAEAETAGVLTPVTGGGYNVAAPAGMTSFCVRGTGVASSSASISTLEFLFSADDGNTSETDNFVYIGRHSVSKIRTAVTTGGSTVATLDPNGTAFASMQINVAARFKANDFAASVGVSGPTIDNLKTDTAGGLATMTRFTLGNRFDGLRPWNGSIDRIVIWTERELSNVEVEMLSGYGHVKGLGYSWWNRPQAITRLGKTYFVGISYREPGSQFIVQMDQRGIVEDVFRLTAGVYGLDDHSTGWVDFLPDGRLITGYNGHGEDGVSRFRRSATNQVGDLGAEVEVSALADVTYDQFHQWAGRLFFVMQGGSNRYWDVFTSDDDGDTWTRRKRIFEGVSASSGIGNWYIYPAEADESGVVTYYTQQHPSNSSNLIKRFYLDLTNGDVLVSGTVLGNIYDDLPNTPVLDDTECELVRTPESGHSQRLLSVRADGKAIGICDFVTADNSSPMYKVSLEGEGGWTESDVVAATPSFSPTNNPTYFPGFDFAQEPHDGIRVYLARYTDGSGKLERYDSADGVTFTATELVNTGTNSARAARPVCPKGATADMVAIFQRVSGHTDFTSWQMDVLAVL
ncbi:hypothetical protein GCM10007276_12250 [Agaricicola taiwanensis]|uniref:Uncharacterized protein n=1 Tax=Agaricicola taiwanensis TaxID=591372 RepID=A0A8J2VUW6_9RHOB|nr:hypothetical protein [Agaricicola taiwanensis]GGE36318.1 hypothetical protein GCM10007276_12250 [Agaricicola taiwanensis]